ncbi:hypothetical protein GGI07_002693 [Coemansia sp. Benny D115]|nr:hypothetical protein GGI07_002693 [Coemansia sp. Benny D115]
MAALLDWLLDQLRALLPSRASQRTGASVAVRLILASAALFTVILSSTLLYATFYRLYVPTLLHEAPVYLQYGDSLTTASVDFVPHANYKFLSTSQPYTVHLELYVPESEANQEMANFMVTLDLCDRMNRTVWFE